MSACAKSPVSRERGTSQWPDQERIAEISNSRVTFSLTSTPPVSSAAFHETP
jgi:hypothetical protein